MLMHSALLHSSPSAVIISSRRLAFAVFSPKSKKSCSSFCGVMWKINAFSCCSLNVVIWWYNLPRRLCTLHSLCGGHSVRRLRKPYGWIQLKGVKAVLTLTFKTRGRLASLKKATARRAFEPCGKGNYPKRIITAPQYPHFRCGDNTLVALRS